MSEHVVAKFGGTSMADPGAVAEVIANRPDHEVIVVSAPGKAEGFDIKMTDQLLVAADSARQGDKASVTIARDAVIDRFDAMYGYSVGALDRGKLKDVAMQLFADGLSTKRPVNHYASLGEELSARYFASRIDAHYLPATWVTFKGNAALLVESSLGLVQAIKDAPSGARLVTPGFYGFDERGNRRLLGRGGSDRTGAIAARGLVMMHRTGVTYENWTDQDGICTADPRVVDGTKVITELTRREVREGAHGGSGVLQGDTIVDLNGSPLTTIVRNTFNTKHSGTRVVTERTPNNDRPVVAIAGRELVTVSIDDLGMADQRGYLRAVLERAEAHGLSVEHMPAAQDAVTLTLHAHAPDELISSFAESTKRHALSKNAKVSVDRKAGVVYLVGEALSQPLINAEVLGRAATMLASHEIGVDAIVSHKGSPSIAFLLEQAAVVPAQRLLHHNLIG